MKLRLLTLLFFLFLLSNAEAKRIGGYYITNTNDTVKVIFKIPINLLMPEPNFDILQKRVTYFDSKNIKHILQPEMIKEYSFNYNGELYRMLSRNNDLRLCVTIFNDRKKIFLRIINDGRLKHMKYYLSQQGVIVYIQNS